MPSDIARLSAQLAQHLHDLSQLEVVEAAEDVVRRRHLQLLASELAELGEDLAAARRLLDLARQGDDLASIINAEEQVCGILRHTTVLQRQTGEHTRSFKHAHDAYLTRRHWLVDRIDQLRRLVAR
jgi:hypothetical protein